ncbi:MAG: IS5/IS1182 family transposase, partial [Moorea sp. SIO4A1]|nr:IS5/IS1182 family transposase [Moorena sp. SIO4A1]
YRGIDLWSRFANATRYDKRAKNFLGAIYLAAAVIWLN